MSKWKGKLTLKSIQLTNFRQFDSLNIEFDDQLTVFIGKNGSGKTTVVDAIVKSLRVFAERIQRPDSDMGEIKQFFPISDIKYLQNAADIKVQVYLLDKPDAKTNQQQIEKQDIEKVEASKRDEIDYYRRLAFEELETVKKIPDIDMINLSQEEDRISNALSDQIRFVENKYRNNITSIGAYEQKIEWKISTDRKKSSKGSFSELGEVERIGRTIDAFLLEEGAYIPVIVHYPFGLLRSSEVPANDLDSDIFDTYKTAFDGLPVSLTSLTYWYRAEEGKAKEKKDYTLLNNIQHAVYLLLNEGEEGAIFNNLRISFLENNEGELVIDKQNTPLRISQLSSGEKILFLMVADLARRMTLATPDSINPLQDGSGIVVVDEIDLHLHPAWQRSIITKLQTIFPNVQWIVTTHSPLVITHLDSERSRVGLLQPLQDIKIKWLSHYSGWPLQEFMYEYYGIAKRPDKTQKDIDDMIDQIDMGNLHKAILYLDKLKSQLGSKDPAILDAEYLLDSIG